MHDERRTESKPKINTYSLTIDRSCGLKKKFGCLPCPIQSSAAKCRRPSFAPTPARTITAPSPLSTHHDLKTRPHHLAVAVQRIVTHTSTGRSVTSLLGSPAIGNTPPIIDGMLTDLATGTTGAPNPAFGPITSISGAPSVRPNSVVGVVGDVVGDDEGGVLRPMEGRRLRCAGRVTVDADAG